MTVPCKVHMSREVSGPSEENAGNVPRVISTEFHVRNHDRSVNLSFIPTPIRMMAHIIMNRVREQTATKTSFLRSGSIDFQTT